MKENSLRQRVFEIIPGFLSWSIISILVLLAFVNPVACAVIILVFDFYWIIRTVYLTTLLVMAHHRLYRERAKDWLKLCPSNNFHHLIIFPVYKEGLDILRPSLEAIKKCHYPKDKIIVAVAFEERNPDAYNNARALETEFKDSFRIYLSTFHPDGIAGEKPTKGANATWAAKKAKAVLNKAGIRDEDIILSCFDADTCVNKEYFGCLTYHFAESPKPHQSSYQPMPVYNNNIWQAPSFARLVEISSSFCQMIEGMRLEKFVTFSSHSMSFKTLVDIGYWPVDMVSDDSVIYWKAFLFYKGDYRVIPLYLTVSMDIAYSSSFIKTITMQYKQKRRWAWGVENFPFLMNGFLGDRDIPLIKKVRRGFHLLETHITWAIWAVILLFIGPLPVIFGGTFFNQMAIGYNLSKISGLLLSFTLFTSLVWIVLSRLILPPRPKEVSWFKNVIMTMEWFLVPFIILILGSTPALDAQTHLALGKYMEFNPTPKSKKMV